MIRVKIKGVAIDSFGNEQEVDIFLIPGVRQSGNEIRLGFDDLPEAECEFTAEPSFDPWGEPDTELDKTEVKT